jgi:hypothetical protein
MKEARRQENKQRKPSGVPVAPGEDPDIAGIVPGPQPSPWGDDVDMGGDETDEESDDR